jgi:hypothetical protein
MTNEETKGETSRRIPPGPADFPLGLLFDPQNAGIMFLKTVRLPLNYTALHPKRPYSSYSMI